jgi:hypothetical protein
MWRGSDAYANTASPHSDAYTACADPDSDPAGAYPDTNTASPHAYANAGDNTYTHPGGNAHADSFPCG